MLDLFAHPQSRVAFQSETEEMTADEGVDDAVVSARKLLADEPIAILYCIDGSFVRASPSILKTTNGSDDTAASVQMREMVQNSFKEYLAKNKGDDVKQKYYGAAEVRGRVGAWVCSLVTCFVCVHRIWG